MKTEIFMERGLLPKEMPPCFTSSSLKMLFTGGSSPSFDSKQSVTKPVAYSLARAGGSRRSLKIPNPCSYFRLADALCTDWSKVETLIDRSDVSISKPTLDPENLRAVVPSISLAELLFARQKNRATGRYALSADLSEFYPSLYSHALAWAIEGKAAAKVSKGRSGLFGDKIDAFTRALHDNETTGIPIGPDVSLVLAELLLSAVDLEIVSKHKPKSALRYFDDFELIFDKKDEATRALSDLESILRDYKLTLNPQKTKIVELPAQMEKPWIRDLRVFDLPSLKGAMRIHDYFELAISYQQLHLDQLVMSYAVSRLSAIVSPSNWEYLEPILLQVLRTTPETTPIVINTFAQAQSKACPIDLRAFEDCLNDVICAAAELNHSSEACWAMWAIAAFDLKIGDQAITYLERSIDSTMILMTMYLKDLGCLKRNPVTGGWELLLAEDFTISEYWLLGYEAYTRGWLVRKNRFIENNQFFSNMERQNCSFLSPVTIKNEVTLTVSRRLSPYGEIDDSDYDYEEDENDDDESVVDEDDFDF